MKTINQNQKGFTLIELAIVMIIIGILLGGVLKGQELIKSAKIKATASEIEAYKTAYWGYKERFGATPGDDLGQVRWGLTAGSGNDRIDGANCNNNADESCMAIRALRYAGFIKGDPSETQPKPKFSAAGEIHMYYWNFGIGHIGNWLVSHNYSVPKEVLKSLDVKLDDGKCNTGDMIATSYSNTSYCDPATGEYMRDQWFAIKLDN